MEMKRRKTIRVSYGRKPAADAPSMAVENRQSRLAANAEAIERWQRRLFRAATELKKLSQQRKRLLGPKKPTAIRYRILEPHEQLMDMAGGDDFNDELPPL
jgi:hypothetical protein